MIPEVDTHTTAGDSFRMSADSQGVYFILTQTKTSKDDVLDVTIGSLRHTSILAALGALRSGTSYTTTEGNCRLELMATQLHLTVSYRHAPQQTFTAILSACDTGTVMSLLSELVSAPASTVTGSSIPVADNVGRNDPCPCGSGRKYKKCCLGKPGEIPDSLRHLEQDSDHTVLDVIGRARQSRAYVESADFLSDLGVALGTGGRHDEAIAVFRRASEMVPARADLRVNLAVTLGNVGKTEEALGLLDTIPARSYRKEVCTANILFNIEKYDQCIPLYETAIEVEPGFYLPYVRLVQCLARTGSPALEHWLARAVQMHRQVPMVAKQYCLFLLKRGRLDELVDADWIDALRSEAGRPDIIGRQDDDVYLIVEAQLMRAAAQVIAGHATDRLERAVQVLDASPNEWHLCDVARLLALAAADMGQPDLAEAAFRRVCQSCRDGKRAPRTLEALQAHAFGQAKDYASAARASRGSLEIAPDEPRVLGMLWWALDELGETAEAITVAERLLAIAPETDDLRYNLGFLCGKEGRLGRAISHYQAASASWRANENLAFILLLNGEIESAEEAWALFTSSLLSSGELPTGHVVTTPDGVPLEGEAALKEALAAKAEWKTAKFTTLVKIAKERRGSYSYAADLLTANSQSEPFIGAHLRIPDRWYSVEDALKALADGDAASRSEARFGLQMQNLGDLSPVVEKFRLELDAWNGLPEEARLALLEGENRFQSVGTRDYSLAVVGFAKAVEICVRDLAFEPFKALVNGTPEFLELVNEARATEPQRLDKLLKYLERGQHLELGTMGLQLDLCTGSTAKKVRLLQQLGFLLQVNGLGHLLSRSERNKLHALAASHRNPAAHSAAVTRDEAAEARILALEILGALPSLPPQSH